MHNKRILKQLADYYNPPAEKPAAEPRPAAK
jgi:hypothetical protein